MLRRLWAKRHEQRLGWAERAYDNFVEKIAPELNQCISTGHNEVTVVLFGETQVGKTTLLLKLLGIRHEDGNAVAQILRGGQVDGKASTATPMRYRKSSDDHWYLGGSKNSHTKEGVEDALRLIRRDVEKGVIDKRLDYTRPIELKIPQKYFHPQHEGRLSISIIDLPGANPENSNEASFVMKVAERYVPAADLILMVGRADGLGFLNPDNLQIPQIEDWRYAPQRFRIITTYSTTLQTQKEYWTNNPDIEKIRSRLMSQVETFGIKDIRSEYFYPLEFGKSWTDLESSEERENKVLFQKASPLMERLFDDLFDDIAKSATKHNRIMQAANLHVGAQVIKRNKLIEFQNQLNELKKKLDKIRETLAEFQKLTNEKRNEIKKKTTEIKDIPSLHDDLCCLADEYIRAEGMTQSIGTNTKEFFEYLTSMTEQLKKEVKKFTVRIENDYSIQADETQFIKQVAPLVDDVVLDLRRRLNNYGRTEYYPSIFDAYDMDVKESRKLIKEARNKLRIKSVEDVEICISKVNSILTYSINRLEKKRDEYSLAAQNKKEDLNFIQNEIDARIKECKEFAARMKSSERLSRQFEDALKSEFMSEITIRKIKIKTQSPIEQFIELCAIEQLKTERDKLLTN